MSYIKDKVCVLIVDDIESFRVRFKNILSSDEGIEIVGIAKNGYEAIILAALKKPDVILMDVRMENDISGIEASKEIIKFLPETKIIITSVIDDDDIVVKAYEIGVVNYIIKKNANSKDVLNAVYDAYKNQSSISPEIAEKLLKEFKKIHSFKDSILFTLNIITKLTPVEIDILLLLCDSYTRKEISEVRHIAFSTVKTHINNILSKTNKTSSKELVQLLVDANIIDMLKQTRSDGDGL